jgi:hypothetical protein
MHVSGKFWWKALRNQKPIAPEIRKKLKLLEGPESGAAGGFEQLGGIRYQAVAGWRGVMRLFKNRRIRELIHLVSPAGGQHRALIASDAYARRES